MVTEPREPVLLAKIGEQPDLDLYRKLGFLSATIINMLIYRLFTQIITLKTISKYCHFLRLDRTFPQPA
jgi:hypothetical protein